MKTFTNMDAARQLHKLYSTKALSAHVGLMLHPIAEDDFEARALQLDDEVEAMDVAEDALGFLDKIVHNLAGTQVWSKAMEIAYAPIEFGGYQRVAEYYRRAEQIQAVCR